MEPTCCLCFCGSSAPLCFLFTPEWGQLNANQPRLPPPCSHHPFWVGVLHSPSCWWGWRLRAPPTPLMLPWKGNLVALLPWWGRGAECGDQQHFSGRAWNHPASAPRAGESAMCPACPYPTPWWHLHQCCTGPGTTEKSTPPLHPEATGAVLGWSQAGVARPLPPSFGWKNRLFLGLCLSVPVGAQGRPPRCCRALGVGGNETGLQPWVPRQPPCSVPVSVCLLAVLCPRLLVLKGGPGGLNGTRNLYLLVTEW